jgi:hypothetical protein
MAAEKIDEVLLKCCEVTMEEWFQLMKNLEVTQTRTKEEFYGFHASDIAELHFYVMGFGECVFFRLHNGRVFDVAAREHDPNPLLYDQTTH